MPEWREGFIIGGETRFFARALGHGPDLMLMLHGWPEDGSCWRRVAPMAADAGWRVVCPDLKGFGRSDSPPTGYDSRTLADEISRLITSLHVRKAVVVGHDWGGAVALATALRHPGRIRSLILSNSPYRRLDLRRAWHVPLLNIPVIPETATRFGAEQIVRAVVSHTARVHEGFTDDVIVAYAEAIRTRGWLNYYRTLPRQALVDAVSRRLRRALPGFDPAPGPPSIRPPVHLLWGEHDPVLPPAIAREMADDLGATVTLVPDVGHFPHEEDPLAFGRALLSAVGEPTDTPSEAEISVV
jgi:pimeloyl-ACP methyl ester carboxylesterase